MVKLIGAIDVSCTLGEGPVWDDRLDRLWWTDIQESRLHYWDWSEKVAHCLDLPERLGSLGLTSDPDWLVCAFASGFALFQPATGTVRWLERPEENYRGIRFNDGRIDRAGRFWAGTMVEDQDKADTASGSLYMLDHSGRTHRHFDGVSIANSLCFSNDGQTLYFADTPTRVIRSYDVPSGLEIGEPEVFAETSGPGWPDGSDIDAENCLWNAEWGASRLTRYNSDGSVRETVDLPVSQPTCVAFGGPKLDHLFVTSAREGLSAGTLASQPEAGKVLILKTGATGLPAVRLPVSGLEELY